MKSQFSHTGHKNMKESGKTYAEYLADRKPITRDLAPVGALPKYSKGDTHRSRRKIKAMKNHGEVFIHQLPTKKDGTLKKATLKRMRSI